MLLLKPLHPDVENTSSILISLVIVVLKKHLEDLPTDEELGSLVKELGDIKPDLSFKEMFNVFSEVERCVKYSDATIVETFLHYQKKMTMVTPELIDRIIKFDVEYN
jgi:hypothetical protein